MHSPVRTSPDPNSTRRRSRRGQGRAAGRTRRRPAVAGRATAAASARRVARDLGGRAESGRSFQTSPRRRLTGRRRQSQSQRRRWWHAHQAGAARAPARAGAPGACPTSPTAPRLARRPGRLLARRLARRRRVRLKSRSRLRSRSDPAGGPVAITRGRRQPEGGPRGQRLAVRGPRKFEPPDWRTASQHEARALTHRVHRSTVTSQVRVRQRSRRHMHGSPLVCSGGIDRCAYVSRAHTLGQTPARPRSRPAVTQSCPPAVSAKLASAPHATLTMHSSRSSDISLGCSTGVVEICPHCPSRVRPQQYALPSSSHARQCASPAETCVTVACRASALTATGSCSRRRCAPLPSPNAPDVPSPQAHSIASRRKRREALVNWMPFTVNARDTSPGTV